MACNCNCILLKFVYTPLHRPLLLFYSKKKEISQSDLRKLLVYSLSKLYKSLQVGLNNIKVVIVEWSVLRTNILKVGVRVQR